MTYVQWNYFEYINPVEAPKVIDAGCYGAIPTTNKYRRIIKDIKEGVYSKDRLATLLNSEWRQIVAGKREVERKASEYGISDAVNVIINGHTLAKKALYWTTAEMSSTCEFAYRNGLYANGEIEKPIPSANIIIDLNNAFDPELREAIRKALDARPKRSKSDVIHFRDNKDGRLHHKFNFDAVLDRKRNGSFSVKLCDEIIRFNNAALRYEAAVLELKDALEMQEKLSGEFQWS